MVRGFYAPVCGCSRGGEVAGPQPRVRTHAARLLQCPGGFVLSLGGFPRSCADIQAQSPQRYRALPSRAWRQADSAARAHQHSRPDQRQGQHARGCQRPAKDAPAAAQLCGVHWHDPEQSGARRERLSQQGRRSPYMDGGRGRAIRPAPSGRQQGAACPGAIALHGTTQVRHCAHGLAGSTSRATSLPCASRRPARRF